MKNIIGLLFLTAFLAFSTTSEAVSPTTKHVTAVIQTSAQCGMCKSTIETSLKSQKGIKWVILDVETKKLTVKYDAKKISLAEIKKAINDAGYDADDAPATASAYKNLSACCQKGGMEH